MTTEKQLATIGGRLGDYNTAYSILSDAAHTSPTDIQSFLKHDENRTLLGFMYGPHDKELTTYAVYAMSLQMDNLVNFSCTLELTSTSKLTEAEIARHIAVSEQSVRRAMN